MTIVNVGVSHRFAPAEMLEKLAVPSAELGDVLTRLHIVPSIDEVAVLCTCNRVEVYAAASGPAGQVTRALAGLVAARGRLPVGEVLRMARVRVGGAAAEHLFSVACGLDSMAVGEEQIVAQIKAAARAAAAAGTTGPAIIGLIDAALRASKRARTQTTISTEGISLARAGLDIAAAHLGGLADRHGVVLGTGSTGKLAARLLREAGVARLSVASRNAAFPAREDPRDALIWPGGTSLEALPPGTRIGTGSPRRAALLRATGRQLQIVPMRGNVDSRLRKLADGEVDALVLAMAGLSRLGLLDRVVTPLDPSLLMPAPAQGVLAVECRTDDPVTAAQLGILDHAPTRAAATTERSFLAALGAGCSTPVGALAEVAAETGAEPAMRVSGLIAAPDGSSVIRAHTTGAVGDGDALGRRLAHMLFKHGGAVLLDRASHGVTDPRSHPHPGDIDLAGDQARPAGERSRSPAGAGGPAVPRSP